MVFKRTITTTTTITTTATKCMLCQRKEKEKKERRKAHKYVCSIFFEKICPNAQIIQISIGRNALKL